MTGIEVAGLEQLDPAAGPPRYRQIADRLAAKIQDARPGVRLPSEHELVRHFGVSRATATQALRELEQRGLVSRRQGRGTFVADPERAVRSNPTESLPSFSDDLRRAGHATAERVLAAEQLPCPSDVAGPLGVARGDQVWRVERVIVSDGEPVVHLCSWLPVSLYPSMDVEQIERTSLYEYLLQLVGPDGRPRTADEQWSAARPPADTARHLQLARNAPVMRVLRTAYLPDGRPAEFVHSHVRGESFAVAIRIGSDASGKRVLEQVDGRRA